MPFGVYQPRRWRSQPQGPVEIDWGHPLARGLQFMVFGSSARDRVGGIMPSVVGTPPNVDVSTFGAGLRFTGANALSYARQARHQPSSGVSVLCVCLPNARANDTQAMPFASGDSVGGTGQATFFVNHIISLYGTHGINTGFCNSSGFDYGAGTGIGENSTYSKALVFSGGAAPAVKARAFRDGFWRSEFSEAINAHYSPPDGSIVVGARTAALDRSFPGAIYLSAMWTRMLGDAEHLALHANPWQLLRPRRPIVYSLPSSTPVLSAATVIDIGTTSARPRVTITI